MMNRKQFSALLVLALFSANSILAQTDTLRIRKNEFGIDATGFIRFFTQFQNTSDYDYVPTYYVTYRRYFEPGNIRFGIGGGGSNEEQPSPYGDSTIYNYNSSSMDARIGWEFKSELSRRWQVYYGLDFRYSLRHTRDEAASFNGGYALGVESSSKVFGLAPVLGFRFRINSRISILTEANLSLNWAKYKNKNFYTPLAGYPAQPDVIAPDTKSFYTSFAQPISVYFTFSI